MEGEMSLLMQMIIELSETEVPGSYNDKSQTWSIECDAQRSPQKHHQEN